MVFKEKRFSHRAYRRSSSLRHLILCLGDSGLREIEMIRQVGVVSILGFLWNLFFRMRFGIECIRRHRNLSKGIFLDFWSRGVQFGAIWWRVVNLMRSGRQIKISTKHQKSLPPKSNFWPKPKNPDLQSPIFYQKSKFHNWRPDLTKFTPGDQIAPNWTPRDQKSKNWPFHKFRCRLTDFTKTQELTHRRPAESFPFLSIPSHRCRVINDVDWRIGDRPGGMRVALE